MTMNTIDAIKAVLNATSSYGGANSARDTLRELVSAYDALAPDWSQAPEWAQWCTIDHDGRYSWYRAEPKWTSNEPGEWAYTQRARGEYVSIPIGIDWRLCKWQRPEVAA